MRLHPPQQKEYVTPSYWLVFVVAGSTLIPQTGSFTLPWTFSDWLLQQHIGVLPSRSSAADADPGAILQLAAPTSAIETFVFRAGSADGCELLGKVLPRPMKSHGSVVRRGSLGSGEGLNAFSIKVDLLNGVAVFAFKVLDDIPDAGTHRFSQLWLIARRCFGPRSCPALLSVRTAGDSCP